MFRWIFLVCCVTFIDARYFDSAKSLVKRDSEKVEENVCDTEQCRITATLIKNSIDESVNPCDNFYLYACGKYSENYPIPPSTTTWNVWSEMKNTVDERVRGILESEETETELEAVKKAKKLYRLCMDTEKMQANGVKSLLKFLDGGGGWPLTMKPDEWNENEHPWNAVETHYTRRTGILTFVTVNTEETQLYGINEPGFMLLIKQKIVSGDRTFNNSDYRKLMEKAATEIIKERNVDIPAETLAKDIDDMLDFEKQIFEAYDAAKAEEDNNPKEAEETKTMIRDKFLRQKRDDDEIDESFSPEETALQDMWGSTLDNVVTDIIDVNMSALRINPSLDVPYFIKLNDLVKNTPMRTVVNYVYWRFLLVFLKYATPEFYEAQMRMYMKKIGLQEMEPRWKFCIGDMSMPEVLSHEYVKSYFPEETKAAIAGLIDKIQKAVNDEIANSPWMSEGLKEKAKEKVDSMRKNIGYPEWYKNATALEERYEDLEVVDDYFETILNVFQYLFERKIKNLKEQHELDEFKEMTPITLNAMYMPTKNSLTITAGDFQAPMFSASQPAAANYGFLGYLLSHEVSHGFDSTGRAYDTTGNKVEWPEDMDQEYNERQKCFVEQYNDYNVTLDDKVFKINGTRTLDDNIADGTGLRAAYGAFKQHMKETEGTPSVKLPGLEKFDDEELFFLSSAAIWCEHISLEELKSNLLDEHSPQNTRVIGALSNMPEFAEAYECPEGSPMNPSKKCNIWK